MARVIAALAIYLSSCGFANAMDHSFDLKDALSIKALSGNVRISADGAWIAYTIQDPQASVEEQDNFASSIDARPGSHVWINNTQTGETRPVISETIATSAPVWSRDGMHLAFYAYKGGSLKLWIWDRSTNRAHQVSDHAMRLPSDYASPTWMPDGFRIIVAAWPADWNPEERIAGGLVESNKHPRNAEEQRIRVYKSGGVLAHDPNDSRTIDSSTAESESKDRDYLCDLLLFDLRSGSYISLARMVRVESFSLSPDAERLAYLRRNNSNGRDSADIVVSTLNEHSSNVVAKGVSIMDDLNFTWSPDSRSLAFCAPRNIDQSDCYVASVESGTPVNVTRGDHPRFGGWDRRPLWGPDSKSLYLYASPDWGTEKRSDALWKVDLTTGTLLPVISIAGHAIIEIFAPARSESFWSPDGGRSLLLVTKNYASGEQGVFLANLHSGNSAKLFEGNFSFGNGGVDDVISTTDVSLDGTTVLYGAQSADHPLDLWTADPLFKKRKQRTQINPQLDSFSFGTSALIEWKRDDGALMHGAIILPAQYKPGTRYPLIVYIYGGAALSNCENTFGGGATDFNIQLLSTRGYAVLLADTWQGNETPMADIANSLLPGVQRAVDLGIADSDAIGLIGHSHGGYSTLAVISQTRRFHAAVAMSGIYDLFSGYGAMNVDTGSGDLLQSVLSLGRMPGDPSHFPQRYVQNSPIVFLDRISTPLLLIHGAKDSLPAAQSEEVFVGLRRLDKEVEYVRYEKERHTLADWERSDLEDCWSRVLAWFDNHLKPSPSTNTMKSHR